MYSPVKGTRDGSRRLEEDKKKRRASELSENWALLRLCKSTIAENGGKWERRGRDETQRIRDAERKERLTIIEEKKRRFGKKYLKKE